MSKLKLAKDPTDRLDQLIAAAGPLLEVQGDGAAATLDGEPPQPPGGSSPAQQEQEPASGRKRKSPEAASPAAGALLLLLLSSLLAAARCACQVDPPLRTCPLLQLLLQAAAGRRGTRPRPRPSSRAAALTRTVTTAGTTHRQVGGWVVLSCCVGGRSPLQVYLGPARWSITSRLELSCVRSQLAVPRHSLGLLQARPSPQTTTRPRTRASPAAATATLPCQSRVGAVCSCSECPGLRGLRVECIAV